MASVGNGQADGTRRTEILEAAASLIASSGLRTSLQEIADAAGILPGSLYHHFESKEAILIELIRRYHADLDRIGEIAQQRLDEPDSRPVSERIVELGSAIANCAVRHRAALQLTFHEPPTSANQELVELARRPPQRGSGGDARNPAGRQAERLHPARHRPSHAGGPDLPDDAARRARRDPARCRCRSGGRDPVSDPVARTRQPTAQRCEAGSLERPPRREPGHRDVERRERSRSRATRLRTFAPSHEPSSVAEATKPRPSGTSRPRPASAPAPSTG